MIKNLIQTYKVYIGLALALAILAGACYLTWLVTDSNWQSKYNQQQTEYADASAKASQAARDKEHEYAANLAKANAEGDKRVAASNAAAVSANASVIRLQQRINKILANTSTEDSTTGQQGKSPREALDMLANVLGKSIERNRQLAAFGDKAWDAAKQCEDSYYALQQAN